MDAHPAGPVAAPSQAAGHTSSVAQADVTELAHYTPRPGPGRVSTHLRPPWRETCVITEAKGQITLRRRDDMIGRG